jgi:predicted nucleotidyltransferase
VPFDETMHETIRSCLADYPEVIVAYLYGSRAARRAHRESDVDIGVLLDRERLRTRAERFDMRVQLTSSLIAALHFNEIDVVVLNDAPPGLARHVALEGTVVHCVSVETEHAFRRDAQLRAADIAPFLRRTRQTKLRALGS